VGTCLRQTCTRATVIASRRSAKVPGAHSGDDDGVCEGCKERPLRFPGCGGLDVDGSGLPGGLPLELVRTQRSLGDVNISLDC
jgi:hypothetical protein